MQFHIILFFLHLYKPPGKSHLYTYIFNIHTTLKSIKMRFKMHFQSSKYVQEHQRYPQYKITSFLPSHPILFGLSQFQAYTTLNMGGHACKTHLPTLPPSHKFFFKSKCTYSQSIPAFSLRSVSNLLKYHTAGHLSAGHLSIHPILSIFLFQTQTPTPISNPNSKAKPHFKPQRQTPISNPKPQGQTPFQTPKANPISNPNAKPQFQTPNSKAKPHFKPQRQTPFQTQMPNPNFKPQTPRPNPISNPKGKPQFQTPNPKAKPHFKPQRQTPFTTPMPNPNFKPKTQGTVGPIYSSSKITDFVLIFSCKTTTKLLSLFFSTFFNQL